MAKKSAPAAAETQPETETDDEKKALFGGMTDEQRADMTDEELEGIDGSDDEDDGEGDDEAEEIVVEPEDKDKSEDDDADPEAEAADDADDADADAGTDAAAADTDTPATEDATEAGEIDDDDEDALDVTRSVLPNEWQVPKDAEETVKGISQQIVELADKFDAGDLSAREYHEQRTKLDTESIELRMQINDARKAWGKALNDWSSRTCKAFIRDHQQYDAEKSPTLNNMLDAEVRRLQVDSPDPFNPRILRKAHANIQAAIGNPVPDKPKAAARAKDKAPVVPGKKPQVPPTLARVPQDEIEDAEGGKYARLSRLSDRDPHAFEVAFMRLSPKERDEYLASA